MSESEKVQIAIELLKTSDEHCHTLVIRSNLPLTLPHVVGAVKNWAEAMAKRQMQSLVVPKKQIIT